MASALTGLLALMPTAFPTSASAAPGAVYDCYRTDYGCVSGTGYTGTAGWGYPGPHNCTLYAAFRLSQNGYGDPSGLGNAYDWDDRARARGVAVDGNPAVGAIAQWDGGDGHVAYVEGVFPGYITITEDNWGGGTGAARIYSGSNGYAGAKFLHFADLTHYQPFAADFNGDGLADIGLRDAHTGAFFIKHGPTFTDQVFYQWAAGTNYQAFAGDFNGDGLADIGVRDSNNGIFYIRFGPTFASQTAYGWAGGAHYQPFAADFNGDGLADIGLRDPNNGIFYIRFGPTFASQTAYGWAGGRNYKAFAADFNGDHLADIGVKDKNNGVFYIRFGPSFGAQTAYGWAAG